MKTKISEETEQILRGKICKQINMVRYKNRFVLFHIKSDKKLKLSSSEIADNLRKSIRKFYGDHGSGMTANLCIKVFNEKHQLAIARCAHGPHQFLTSILPLLSVAGKELAKFRILYVGATIRQCKKYIIKHQNEVLRQIVKEFNDNNERQAFLKDLTDNISDMA